jgi:hypothetical protein
MTPLDELMMKFSMIQDVNRPVKLLNSYRGIPISHDARILTISQGYVAFKVHEYQAVCMTLEGRTFIQHPVLPEILQAAPVSVDVGKKEAILTEFVGVGHSIGKRMSSRVQPKEPIDVEIYDGDHRIPGKLADVSTSGVGVFTFATYIYGDLSFEKNTDVYLDLRLPSDPAVLRFQGKITSITHQKGTFLHRLGLRIFPNPAAEPALQHYLAHRQEEITRELENIYQSMVREKKD